MSAKEKGGKEIVGDDERAIKKRWWNYTHEECFCSSVALHLSLGVRTRDLFFFFFCRRVIEMCFPPKAAKCAPWKSIFSQKGGEDMDVVDEIRLKAFHSHGGVFIANEYRAIDRLYRSEEGCVRRDDCAADCAWWALKSSSLGLLSQPKFLFLLLKKNSRK